MISIVKLRSEHFKIKMCSILKNYDRCATLMLHFFFFFFFKFRFNILSNYSINLLHVYRNSTLAWHMVTRKREEKGKTSKIGFLFIYLFLSSPSSLLSLWFFFPYPPHLFPPPLFSLLLVFVFLLICLFFVHFVEVALGGFTQSTLHFFKCVANLLRATLSFTVHYQVCSCTPHHVSLTLIASNANFDF